MSLAAITSGHYLDDAALTTRIWIAIHLRRLPSADALRVVVRGGEVALQDEGGDYLSTREQPPALNAVGAGVSAGVQVRLLGVKPQKSGLDDLGD